MGGKSFSQSAKEELAFSVLSSFLEDSYYEKGSDRMERISKLVAKTNPEFVSKLAVFARREFHLRSVFHLLVGELSKNCKGNSIVKNTIIKGVERPDDLLEILAYVGKPVPNQIKKGCREAIKKFNGYQLAKYKGGSKEYSLVDLFNLVHPKGDRREWRDLIKGELKTPDTWETRLSSGENKTEIWRDLVLNDKLGYMALLRNLRNIVKEGDAETIRKSCEIISDDERVRSSKQFPFRFLSALKALEEFDDEGITFEKEKSSIEEIKEAVNKALEISISNLPLLEGRTLILSDNSGSMRGDDGGDSLLSRFSKRTTADIANLFATLYWKRADNTLIGLFGDRLITPKLDRDKDIFENFKILDKEGDNCGRRTETGIFEMFRKLIDGKVKVDRIVIFSDCQVGEECKWYDSGLLKGNDLNKLFEHYKRINPNVNVYSVDLKGYGNKMFVNGVYLIAGFSEKIFTLMEYIEKKEGFVKYIENYYRLNNRLNTLKQKTNKEPLEWLK